MSKRRSAGWSALCVMALASTACEGEKPTSQTAPPATAPTSKPTSAAAATSKSTTAEKPSGKTRDGDWKVNAPGRGLAYEVSSKGGVVKFSMGGTVLEGQPHEGGRKYTSTSGSEYVVKPIAGGFELVTQDKPTWKVEIADDAVTISAGDKVMSITKAADILAIKTGADVIGKVEAESGKVKVTDTNGTTKYEGDDELIAAWGVLLLKDIGQPMQRLIFTELLARAH